MLEPKNTALSVEHLFPSHSSHSPKRHPFGLLNANQYETTTVEPTSSGRLLHRQRKRSRPPSNLALQPPNLLNRTPRNLSLKILQLIRLLGQLLLHPLRKPDTLINVPDNPLKILLAHAPRRHSRRPDADATRRERALVARCGVLVTRDIDLFQHSLHARAV